MENKDLFHSFNYVVGNDFIYQDKVVVKVFYLYKNTNVINNVDIKKKNNAPESYYKDEAKKIIDQLIKSGELEKYSKLYLKKDKRKKGLAVLIPIASACAIAGITVGTYFAVRPSNAGYEITIPEISGVSIDIKDVKPGKDLEATINVNNNDRKDNPQGLPHSLEIKVGDKVLSLNEYTYTLNPGRESATIHIDASKINGPISFNFTITDLAWYENHYYIDSLKKEDITTGDGVIKTLTVNGVEHKVRLIGVDEDYGKIGDESTKIHTTWEFANLLSDANGNSLATQWNDTNVDAGSNYNYFNSSIRYALNKETGEGGCDYILWAQKGEHIWSTDPLYKDKCVLDMLPNDLVSVLKTPSKYINIYNTSLNQWEEKTVEDKLFLLSPKEMGDESEYQETYTTIYSYYNNAQDADRIKKQVANAEYHPSSVPKIPKGSGQVYANVVSNYAGYNESTEVTGNGGCLWLRSPWTHRNDNAWPVNTNGHLTFDLVYNRALAIAPAFCI